MSRVVIWTMRTTSPRACRCSDGPTRPRASRRSSTAADSIALPRAMAKKRALSGPVARPEPSAILSTIETLARSSGSRSEPSRSPADRGRQDLELDADAVAVEPLAVEGNVSSGPAGFRDRIRLDHSSLREQEPTARSRQRIRSLHPACLRNDQAPAAGATGAWPLEPTGRVRARVSWTCPSVAIQARVRARVRGRARPSPIQARVRTRPSPLQAARSRLSTSSS
jgi:hypothetical protein